jgi:hypothetical protein
MGTSLQRERERYDAIVTAMTFADPSAIATAGLPEKRYSPRELIKKWRTAVREASEEAAWNLYVHVPYCKSICTFCNYQRLRVSSVEALDEYVDFLAAEAGLLGPALDGVKFGGFYVGGGTPSVLSAEQLDRLLGALHRAFKFTEEAQKTFEYDPMVMTDDRFAVLDRFGFRRYSFGIQSMDVSINRLHGRGPQDRRHIDRQFALLEKHGAREANVDFLLGLAGTTPDRMVREIEQLLADHRPNEVSVYFLSPTAAYVGEHFGGDFAAFERFLRNFEQLVPAALGEAALRQKYTLAEGKHMLRLRAEDALRSAHGTRRSGKASSYGDIPSEMHRPLYLLGLGDSARSRIFAKLLYRAEHDAADRDPDSRRYVGLEQSIEDEIWSYVSHSLRDADSLSRPLFRRTFGADIGDLCGKALAKLVELGVARVTADRVTMAKQPRRDRLRDLLFFAPSRIVKTYALLGRAVDGGGRSAAAVSISREDMARLVAPLAEKGRLAKGWTLELMAAGSVELAARNVRLRVRLLSPAGSHPACRTTARYDLQYDLVAGHPDPHALDVALDALAAAIARNEKLLEPKPVDRP